jgi:peptidoglycan hydrolase CwlO-like protein
VSTRVLSCIAVIALAVALVPAHAGAQLSAELDAAKARATKLESRITREEAQVRSMQGELRNLSIAVGREQGGLQQIRADLGTTQHRIDAARAKLGRYRDRIRSRVREMYEHGPLQMVGVVLGSQSLGQFVGRMTYAARLARQDQTVVFSMRRVRAELKDVQAQQRRLEHTRQTTLTSLQSRRDALTNAFARQQVLLADLAQARLEAMRLIDELRDKIDLGGLRRVAGHGMTITYGQWAREFLGAMGAPASRSNQVAVIAWEAAEGTQATWNPLATTFYMPGSTVYNSSGVRNYATKDQGIDASNATLKRPGHGYDAIVASLRKSGDAMDSARAINRSDWCRGCAGGTYVTGFVPAVEQYYDRYGGS